MNTELALMELERAEAAATGVTFEQVLIDGLRAGIPPEILTRMEALWRTTRKIGGRLVRIGRIAVLRIVEFVRANPHLAVGAALTAIVAFLVTSVIPWIGPMLAPFATALAALYGAGAAASRRHGGGISPAAAAKAFAEAFVDMMLAVSDGVAEDAEGDLQ
jgi:hypothetical protein